MPTTQNNPATGTPLPTVNPNIAFQTNVGPLTASNLSSQTPTPYATTQPTPPFDISSLSAQSASQQSPYATLSQPQQQASDLTKQIEDLNSQLSGKSAFQTQQYQQQGFGTQTDANGNLVAVDPGMQDLQTQLDTLSNQAKAIPMQLQNNVQNGGGIVTAGGLAPIQTAALRNNSIQALNVSTLISARNGALGHAQMLVNIATQQKFGPIQAQLAAAQQNLQMALQSPEYSNAEKQQAAQQAQQVAQKQAQMNLNIENYKTAQAAVADALKNNPTDQQALMAAQQAQQLDPNDPNYLAKVQQLVAPYASDLAKRALDMQYQQGQMQLQQGQIAQIPLDAKLKQAQIAQIPLDQQLKKAQIASSYANVALASQGKQNQLEQDYRTSLDKVVAGRTGGLGLQDQKVDQGVHLAALMNQFKDANGNFNIPPAQYAELAIGLASMIAPQGQAAESTIKSIEQKTAAGDIGGALTYILGTPVNGSTQDINKLLAESIDRQAQVASNLRDGYMKFLSQSAPTGLDPARKAQIDKAELNQYTPIMGGANTVTKSGKSFNYAQAKADGVSDADIQAYLASH